MPWFEAFELIKAFWLLKHYSIYPDSGYKKIRFFNEINPTSDKI